MKKVLVVLAILLIAGVVLTGCSGKALKESDVAFADGMVENVLIAENEENYEMWAKDMSDEMIKGISDKDKFEEVIIKPVRGKIGNYIPNSKKFVKAVESKGVVAVYYSVDFEKKNGVQLKFVFGDVNGEKKIVGEWVVKF